MALPAKDDSGLADETSVAGDYEEDDGEDDVNEPIDLATQAHMLALVREFQRRQRHANLLVAGSLAAALLLTLSGFMLIAHLSGPDPAKSDRPVPVRSTSIAWQRPEREAMTAPNRVAKGEPLLIPAKNEVGTPTFGEDASSAQVILAAQGRKLALAPLLGQRHARYVLLRGLPPEAELSAGERTGSGSWMIKDEDMQNLSLTMGEAAIGDYPVDIYLLDAGNAPQARRTLILRVEPARPRVYAAGLSLSWASALLDAAAKAPTTAKSIAPAESSVLLARARSFSLRATSPARGSFFSISPSVERATRPTSSPAPSMPRCWPSSARAASKAILPRLADGTSRPRNTAMPRPLSA